MDFAPPSAWAAWWVRALKDAPHFSWLFVQDHRGGSESPQHIRGYLRALSAAMAQINVTNWVLFLFPPSLSGAISAAVAAFCWPWCKGHARTIGCSLLLNTLNVLYA